jgi:hypothetical protein
MGIRQRFSLVIILVFLAGLLISGYMSYQLLQDKAVESVEQKAGVMMGAASAIRTYTVQQIRPHLEMQMMREFLPQSVPAYSGCASSTPSTPTRKPRSIPPTPGTGPSSGRPTSSTPSATTRTARRSRASATPRPASRCTLHARSPSRMAPACCATARRMSHRKP